MQNHQKRLKFDPDFLPEPFAMIDVVENKGHLLFLQREADGGIFLRYLDDVKAFEGAFPQQQEPHRYFG